MQALPSSYLVDGDGVIRWVNEAARAERGDTSGRHWGEVVSATQSSEVEEFLRQILCSGEPAELSLYIPDSDGTPVAREVSAAPLRDGGTVVGVFGVAARAASTEPHGQIADELVLSKTTVRNHIAHILANLGVHTRVQALVVASRAGLIRLPSSRRK